MQSLGFAYPTDKRTARLGVPLTLDGVALRGARVRSVSQSDAGPFRLFVRDPKATTALWDIPLSEMRGLVDAATVTLPTSIGDFFGALRFDFVGDDIEGLTGPTISALPTLRLDQWARPYSAAELAVAIEREVEERRINNCIYVEGDDFPSESPDFSLLFALGEPPGTIATTVGRIAPILEDILNTTTRALLALARRDSIVTFFEFPSAVRTACQQYLVYFVQFLSDLGIEADAELKEDAQRVLFSVTPRDGADALSRIRSALDAYLSLPESDVVHTSVVQSADIAIQQLEANVLHLKSQLQLASAIQLAQGAAMESLQLSNFQYRQLLLSSGSDSAAAHLALRSGDEEVTGLVKTEQNQEAYFDGTISVSPLKLRNVTIDVPRILRELKRRIRGQ